MTVIACKEDDDVVSIISLHFLERARHASAQLDKLDQEKWQALQELNQRHNIKWDKESVFVQGYFAYLTIKNHNGACGLLVLAWICLEAKSVSHEKQNVQALQSWCMNYQAVLGDFVKAVNYYNNFFRTQRARSIYDESKLDGQVAGDIFKDLNWDITSSIVCDISNGDFSGMFNNILKEIKGNPKQLFGVNLSNKAGVRHSLGFVVKGDDVVLFDGNRGELTLTNALTDRRQYFMARWFNHYMHLVYGAFNFNQYSVTCFQVSLKSDHGMYECLASSENMLLG